MSAKVVPINGDGPVHQQTGIRLSVIELLREKLHAAERGEIIAVGIIWVDPADKVGSKSAGVSRHNLVAGTIYLQQELAKD